MLLNYIKITSLSILIIGVTIASYTDIKYLTVSNKLTSLMFTSGIILGSIFYLNNSIMNLIFYYLSIICVFIFVYLLWRIGLWAGGDVKLFTAISTLFCIDYLDIIPKFYINNHIFPYNEYIIHIPTFNLIVNSVFAILPIILFIVIYDIIKNKPHLIKSIFKKSDINNMIISLNTLTLYFIFNSICHIDNLILNISSLIILSVINNEISKRSRHILLIITIIIICKVIYLNIISTYLFELICVCFIILIKNIFKENLIKEALSYEVNVNQLEESMILSDKLLFYNGEYFYENRTLKNRLLNYKKYEVILEQKAGGLSLVDIEILKRLEKNNHIDKAIKIKKSLPFVPFILSGLIITLSLGNVFALIRDLMGVIL